jgi:hypothetical protein
VRAKSEIWRQGREARGLWDADACLCGVICVKRLQFQRASSPSSARLENKSLAVAFVFYSKEEQDDTPARLTGQTNLVASHILS